MNILFILVLCVIIVFYVSVRFFGEAARIDTDKTLAHLRPKNKTEKKVSEILVFVGIVFGGIYGLFWEKDHDILRYSDDYSWFEKKINNYGANKIKEWFSKGFASGVIKILDYKKIVKLIKKV